MAVVFDAVVPISPRWRRRIILIRGGLGSGYRERGEMMSIDEFGANPLALLATKLIYTPKKN